MRKHIFHIAFSLLLLPLVAQAQFSPQTDKVTERFFPEPDLPATTPGLKKDKGFMNYQELMDWLNATQAKHPELMTISFIGKSQKGKDIPMVTLGKPGEGKVRVWLQGGLHGDEPAGTDAMLFLIDKLLNDPEQGKLLTSLELAIVPMANIDGYEKQRRESANGIDLNRDQTKLQAPESVALKQAFNRFNPQVALDFHEYRPYRKDFTRIGSAGITNIYDAMFLYSGNINVSEELRSFTKTGFVDPAKAELDKHQLRHHDYFTTQKYGGQVEFNQGSVHSRSSATSWALSGAVSTLLEIRGVGIGRTSYKRRVHTSYLIALSYLQSAAKEVARLQTVHQEAAHNSAPVTIISDRKVQKDSLLVIDLASDKELKMPATIHNALASFPTLQRKRPTAYLLSPSEKAAIQRLRILGLSLDSLNTDLELEVETYSSAGRVMEDTEISDDEDAGSLGKAPESKVTISKRKIPKGTYIVYLDQQRAGLACEVLEPENTNGFVENGIVKPGSDGLLPIYRYMKPDKIKP